MTAERIRERELTQRLTDLYVQPMPDYRDELLQRVERTPQRPAWSFPERWLPMSVVTSRVATAPPVRWRTIALLGLLVIALVAGGLLVVGAQRPKLPPPFGPAANGSVIYSWQGDILVRDTLAAEPRLLLGGDGWDVAPSYSPDGTKFMFFRDLGGAMKPGDQELWVAAADGSDLTKVGGPYKECCWVDWSPTGDRIAVAHADSGVDVIDIVRTDGGGSTRLAVDFAVAFPTFRPPDGAQLLFRGFPPDGKGARLYLANADGSDPRALTLETANGFGQGDDFVDPFWSPDGARLAFARRDVVDTASPDQGLRIHVAAISPDGTVTADRSLTGATKIDHEYAPQWLPDGSAITYRQWRGTGEEVMIADAAGAPSPRFLKVSAGSGISVTIAPDGTHLLAVNSNNHRLYRIDLATDQVDDLFSSEDGAIYQRVAVH